MINKNKYIEKYEETVAALHERSLDAFSKRITRQPELSAALVTYGWVAATYNSIDALWEAVRTRL